MATEVPAAEQATQSHELDKKDHDVFEDREVGAEVDIARIERVYRYRWSLRYRGEGFS